METFKNRLLEYARARFDMGQSKFEDYCGINRGTISAIKVQGPTASIVMKIAIKCRDLNLNWLFRGDGDMLLDGNSQHPHDTKKVVIHDIHDNPIVNINYLQDAIKGAIKEAYREIQNEKI